jgi:LacI family transcriptional regulator
MEFPLQGRFERSRAAYRVKSVKRLTIRDVADRAGVSVGTVSHVLNRPEVVAEETRARVLDAIEELGYVRNHAARLLRGIKSQSIALVALDFDNPFFTELARGVEAAASQAGYLVILASSAGDEEREDGTLRMLEEHRVAGILISPASVKPSSRVLEIRRRGTPIVLLDRRRRRRDQCSLAVDDTSGGMTVARHLLSLGHTRLGLLNGPDHLKPCVERRDGFLTVLGEAGLSLAHEHDVETETMTIEAGEAAMRDLLDVRRPPTAVFCGNDLLAIGAERAALARGLSIPHDVAIVGYDDIRFAQTSLVPLTSMRIPSYELGFRAAELLIDEASDGAHHRHQTVLLQPELVIRASTVGTDGRVKRGRARVRAAAAR